MFSGVDVYLGTSKFLDGDVSNVWKINKGLSFQYVSLHGNCSNRPRY